MIKSRLIKIERLIEPFKPKRRLRTWIIASPDPEKRIKEIKTGKIKHPIDKKPYFPDDRFMKIQTVKRQPENENAGQNLEKALYGMARRNCPAGDNGHPEDKRN